MNYFEEEKRNTVALVAFAFILCTCMSFLSGYAFKLFENTVNDETAQMKLASCERGDMYQEVGGGH